MKKLVALALIMMILPCFSLSIFADEIQDEPDAKTELEIKIDYVNELILINGKPGDDIVKYMYSPNVSAGAEAVTRKQAAEKWYPVYGDRIDISQIIPKNNKSAAFIYAFRDADDIAGPDGIFSSRRTSEIIRGRPILSAGEFKSAVNYNPRTERIEISPSLGAYDYQVGLGVWILNNTQPFIDVSSRYNPLGGTVVIRVSAVEDQSFASNEYRIRIPKAPNAPRVRLNQRTGRLTGVQTSMQWSASPNGSFVNFKDRTGNLSVFKDNIKDFEIEKDASGTDCVVLYIRSAATNRLPTSPLQKLLISKALFE